jgi:hypothetical protein
MITSQCLRWVNLASIVSAVEALLTIFRLASTSSSGGAAAYSLMFLYAGSYVGQGITPPPELALGLLKDIVLDGAISYRVSLGQ